MTRTWRAPLPGEPQARTKRERTMNGRQRLPKQQTLGAPPRVTRTKRLHPSPPKGPQIHVIGAVAVGHTQKARHALPGNCLPAETV